MLLLGTHQTHAQEFEYRPLERRGSCDDLEGFGARQPWCDGVAGDGGEIVDESGETVYRITLGRSLRCRLGLCALRHPCRRHDGGTPGLGAFGTLGTLVVEQHRLEFLAHVPFDVVGQHAKEDVGPNPGFAAVVDGPDLQIHGLETAEGAFHTTEPLVGAHRAGAIEVAGRQTGADHVEAVEPGLGGDGGFIALPDEDTILVDEPREVLRHLVFADDLADPLTDLCRLP